jgi:hypothetical protein
MKHCQMDLYKNCSNKSIEVKIGFDPGVIDFPCKNIVKKWMISTKSIVGFLQLNDFCQVLRPFNEFYF